MIDSTSTCSDDVLDAAHIWSCFRQHTTGLAALCANIDGSVRSMIVSTFLPVSIDPPLVAVSISALSRTWNFIRQAERIGVSMLSVEHEHLARAISTKTPGWETLWPMSEGSNQSVFVDRAIVGMECSIRETFVAGDHTIQILKIHEMFSNPDRQFPLLYHEGRMVAMTGIS